MKKYLTVICALLILTAFVSCGDNNSTSEESELSKSSISEITAEEETESTTEIKTEQETTTQKQVYDLDSDIDFNIVSLSFPSSLEINYKFENEYYASLYLLKENDKSHSTTKSMKFHFHWNPEPYYFADDFESYETERFTINGQEYIVTKGLYFQTTIFFTNKTINGKIHYNDEDEELVKQIIETIKFNTEEVETTKEKTTEKVTAFITERPVETQPSENTENNKALKSAKSYVDMSGFSYEGLISQLEYEGFTHDEAVNAVDSCGADWNAEALESAKSYIKMSGFSYTSLISQLEYEKFTHEQAVYGADNCGADWNQQAADSARSYLNVMSMSREELLDQLLYEGFTQEQAEFALQSVGY